MPTITLTLLTLMQNHFALHNFCNCVAPSPWLPSGLTNQFDLTQPKGVPGAIGEDRDNKKGQRA
jgi:hypothetical protein